MSAVQTPANVDGLDFLRSGASAMFNGRQLATLGSYEPPAQPGSGAGIPPSLYVILKATRLCNLRCSYCHAWREGPGQVLSFEHLVDVIAQAMRMPGIRRLYIVWHGGETTLLAPRYFQRAIWLQEHFRIDDRKVGHSVQTNGTRINGAWARFFRDAGFSVGVSLDVDAENHDRTRRFAGGEGSHAAAIAGLRQLEAHRVPHGVLAVVDAAVIRRGADDLLEAFCRQNIRNIGLLNALPANDTGHDQPYLEWSDYVDFLTEVFKAWRSRFSDRIQVRELDSLFNIIQGSNSRLCIFQGGCMGQYLTIEPDGRVSACDKYVGDETHEFGDLRKNTLWEILNSSPGLERVRRSSEALIQPFERCENFQYCRGGCPHDARLNARQGRAGECCGLGPLIDVMKASISKETSS